jgi:hypothetical protein
MLIRGKTYLFLPTAPAPPHTELASVADPYCASHFHYVSRAAVKLLEKGSHQSSVDCCYIYPGRIYVRVVRVWWIGRRDGLMRLGSFEVWLCQM